MSLGSFQKCVSGFTSDHTYQSATVVSYSNDGHALSLTGITWNLLNKCYAKSTEHKYSNNPFDIDELEQYYVLRKRDQLRFLWHQIKSGSVDFIALQEVDIFTREILPDFVKAFLDKIKYKGWFTVHTDKNDNIHKPLIILYNTAKISFKIKRAVLPMASSMKNTSLEAAFGYVGTDYEICITNMHLDYNTDHRQDILEYQQQQIANGKFTILAGDANYSSDKEHYSLIGDLDMPTNIAAPHDSTSFVDDGGKFLRHVDGFMAGPANSMSRVEITEGAGAYFKWQPANLLVRSIQPVKNNNGAKLGKYVCRIFDPKKARVSHMLHISLTGLPWIREKFKHLILV